MKTRLVFCTTLLLLLSAFNTKKIKPKLPGEFVFIPGGTMHIDTGGNTQIHGERSMIVTLSSFYISKYEVSNLQYRQFYNEVSAALPEEDKEKIACDSTGWFNAPVGYNEPPNGKIYYKHPTFNNFPVVNIRQEGAVKYCEWLLQKIQKENPGFDIEVKLPEKHQWIWAAMGGRSQAMYPWGNWYLRNNKGKPMCNFKRVEDYQVIKNRKTGLPEVHVQESSVSFFTSEVKSYYPNRYGLYNMCGNAAEMISEKGICMGGSWDDYGGNVNTRAEATYDGPTPMVGFRPIFIITEKKLPQQ